jgi:hypothetical protein
VLRSPQAHRPRLVLLPDLRRKTRHNVAEIGAVERRFLGDSARKEALTKRTERDKADPKLLRRRQNPLLRLWPPQGILALQSSHGLHGVSTMNRLHACFGQAEVLDLAFLDELFDGAGDVFNVHIRIDTVLIEQIDHIGLQSLERPVGNSPDAPSGRLFRPLCESPSSKPNLVAITTTGSKCIPYDGACVPDRQYLSG